jgi:hypothetical protein
MWANQVLAASVAAANGDAATTLVLCRQVRDRLRRAGRDSLPDLLVPAAVLAHTRGEDERAARWLRAVKQAGRPTQSFQVTCVYRRLRDLVGPTGRDPFDVRSLDAIGDEALEWVCEVAGSPGSG